MSDKRTLSRKSSMKNIMETLAPCVSKSPDQIDMIPHLWMERVLNLRKSIAEELSVTVDRFEWWWPQKVCKKCPIHLIRNKRRVRWDTEWVWGWCGHCNRCVEHKHSFVKGVASW